MRKFALAAAFAGMTIMLGACSDGNEPAAEESAEPQADAAAAVETPAANATLDANTATAEQLASTGLAQETADAIVAGRPYSTVVDLNTRLLETLSPDAARAVLETVFVPVNLNTASREELELIPGMTDRMVHEFEEYRPYEDMNEFDREIGKYVDEAEVARFRNYVTL
jgi:DNA uptake protein ComE-like DNA-binding protein